MDLVDELIKDSLKRTIQEYGIEGTLESIERNYNYNLFAKNRILNVFKREYLNEKI